uniref:Uncharacterized protein n=1 Tax=Arundo donax TaxID=35708 RepID=A0A0A9ARL3_ARUDO
MPHSPLLALSLPAAASGELKSPAAASGWEPSTSHALPCLRTS